MKLCTILLSIGLGCLACTVNATPDQPVASGSEAVVTFYHVPLICGAAPQIGCGSRAKPLFQAMEQDQRIQEAWMNREGTFIALVWNPQTDENLHDEIAEEYFAEFSVAASAVSKKKDKKSIGREFRTDGKWLRGNDVDRLSIEEAGVIAATISEQALFTGLIKPHEAIPIEKDIETYFKTELVKVRKYEELHDARTQGLWMRQVHAIFIRHIGAERAAGLEDMAANYLEGFKNNDAGGKTGCGPASGVNLPAGTNGQGNASGCCKKSGSAGADCGNKKGSAAADCGSHKGAAAGCGHHKAGEAGSHSGHGH